VLASIKRKKKRKKENYKKSIKKGEGISIRLKKVVLKCNKKK